MSYPFQSATTRKPTVLISDDEPLFATALERAARRAGLEPIVDMNSSVLELALKHLPDVIVLDINQNIDGRDLLRQLKASPRTCHIKVIMLSSEEDQFIRHVCFGLGAIDYAVKPFDISFIQKLARIAREEVSPVVYH